MKRVPAFGLMATLALAPAAQAACEPPQPPPASERPVPPARPVRPKCAEINACGDGVADRFNAEVKAFNVKAGAFKDDAQAYVDRLNAYVAAAGAYAKCEAQALSDAAGMTPPAP